MGPDACSKEQICLLKPKNNRKERKRRRPNCVKRICNQRKFAQSGYDIAKTPYARYPKLSELKPSMGRLQVHKTRKEIKKGQRANPKAIFLTPRRSHMPMDHVSSSCERGSRRKGSSGRDKPATTNPCTTRRRAFQRVKGKAGEVKSTRENWEFFFFCSGVRWASKLLARSSA